MHRPHCIDPAFGTVVAPTHAVLLSPPPHLPRLLFFFLNDAPTTEISPLPPRAPLPIPPPAARPRPPGAPPRPRRRNPRRPPRPAAAARPSRGRWASRRRRAPAPHPRRHAPPPAGEIGRAHV